MMRLCDSVRLPGVLLIEPKVFGDDRGFFLELYRQRRSAEAGIDLTFVQDNHSRSSRSVLGGLHYQIEHPQGKLVTDAAAGQAHASSGRHTELDAEQALALLKEAVP